MNLQEFGRHLRELRTSQGIGVREASRRSEVSNPYISQIERGERRPSPDILRRLAPVYGVPATELLDELDHLEKPQTQISERDDVERALRFVLADPRFRFGTRLDGAKLTLEAKRFIVQMYERLTGKRLLG